MSNTGINIAILGKSGVGKSTFCNYIFESDVFTTGSGKPVTGWDQHFRYHSVDHKSFTLNVYDSVGIENGQYDKWKQTLDDFVRKMGPESGKKPMEWLHACMYLINAASARIEPIEEMLIKELVTLNIPLVVILTHCDGATPSQISDLKKRLFEIESVIKNSESESELDFKKYLAERALAMEEAVFQLSGERPPYKIPTLGEDISRRICVVEVCSVAVRKRSGSTQRYGKGEALDYILKNLDLMLRKKIIYYYLDEYSRDLRNKRSRLFDELDNADIGFFDLIKGVFRDGDSFDIEAFFPDIDSIFPDGVIADLSVLDDFLVDLGYESEHSQKTHEIIEGLSANLSYEADRVGAEIEREMTKVGDDIENGSFFNKVGAVLKVTGVVINMRGFIKDRLNLLVDEILDYIDQVRNLI